MDSRHECLGKVLLGVSVEPGASIDWEFSTGVYSLVGEKALEDMEDKSHIIGVKYNTSGEAKPFATRLGHCRGASLF
eukprot:5206564-Lingulodinium_polyedra.AAC.1